MKSARARISGLRMAGLMASMMASILAGCGALIPTQHRIEVARQYMKEGNWRGAAVELRTVVRAHPQNAEAWLLLTELSLDAADPADAPADLDHALAAGAKGPDVDKLRVRTWLETNQPQAALDAIAHHTVALPEPDRSLATARAQLALGQAAKALETLTALLAAHPDLPQSDVSQARVVMAQALANTGQLDAAIQQVDTALRQDPKSPEPPLLKGRMLASRGQFSAAESLLTLALERMPPAEPLPYRLTALMALTEARLAQGEIDAAAKSQALLAKVAPGAPVTHVLDARIRILRGDLHGGINELERVVSDVPNYTEARMLLGGALISSGDLEQAQEQLEEVIQQAPNNVQARKLLATTRLKLNEPEAALSALTPAASSQAADPQMLALLGETTTQMGDSPSATAALSADEQAHPGNETLQLNLAQAYLGTGHADKALAILEKTADDNDLRRDTLLVAALSAARGPQAADAQVEKLLAAHPKDAGVLRMAGAYYATQRAFGRARSLLTRAIQLDPGNEAAVIVLARVEVASGNIDAARNTLQSALAADPKALPVRLALAGVLVGQKAFDQAVHLLDETDPSQRGPGVQFAVARIYLAKGDPKAADAALDRAIAMRPGQAPIVEEAGALLFAAGQYDAALARYAQATTLAPDNAAYWLRAARAQLALSQPVAARKSLEKAARLRPNWLPAVAALASMDLHDHNSQAAIDRVSALLKSEPNDPGALTLKGDVEAAAGNLTEARTAYSAAQQRQPSAALAVKQFRVALAAHDAKPQKPLEDWLAKEPNDAGVRDVLGNYYLSVHDLPSAVEAFQEVVRLSPQNVLALNNLAWAEDRLGHPGALALAERAHQLAPESPDVDDTLGWILARRHDAARALTVLSEAMKLTPQNPELQYHYAYALVQNGRRAEAREVLTKLLASHVTFESQHDAEQLLAATRT